MCVSQTQSVALADFDRDGFTSVVSRAWAANGGTFSDNSGLVTQFSTEVWERLTNDTGSSNSDQITKDAALTGSGVANAVVHFTVDGTAIVDTATADGNGTWNFTPIGLGQGAHTIVASETDSSGDTSTASLTFTLDTAAPATPPAPADSAAINGYLNAVNDTAAQALTGTAENGSTVTIYDNGTQVGTAAADAVTGAWSFTIGQLPDGSTHSYTVTATDAAGNVSQPSAALRLVVDTTGPATPTMPTDSAAMATLNTLVSFNGSNGLSPWAGLMADANGDLFGTTTSGGVYGGGTVFEIVKTASGYASTPTTLVNFNWSNGASPYDSLIADASGDLFGTTASGGMYGYGTVFEIVKTASGYDSTPITLASFNISDGAGAEAGLIADANGDLFGTTPGGTNGTVFEIVKTASGYDSTPTTLVNFNGTNGTEPLFGNLIADANGDLFGTTAYGGAYNNGTVFEIMKTAAGYASTPITLVSFNFPNGGNTPEGGLVADAHGNLFGTTAYGGVYGGGTVFEIVKTASGYASTPTTLVNFNWSNGAFPFASMSIDANGDLFGTTTGGGNGYGTVFEIAKTASGYAGSPITLVSFDATGSNGASPIGGLIPDANGNLLGVTRLGGAHGDGTVFEITGASADSAVVNGYVNAAHDTTNQVLTSTAENGSTVTIYDNGTQVGTAAADAVTGAWSFTIGQLPDGSTHSYTVTATDAAGNVSQPSAALSFVVDTVTPTVAVSIGNTDVNVTNGTATVTFTFSEAPASFALSDTSAVGGTLSTARPTPRPSRAPPTPTSALPR